MLPPELKAKIISLPKSEKHTIVIVTGKELRHKRFAYRMLQEFGELVVAWYELDETISPKEAVQKKQTKPVLSKHAKVIAKLKELPQTFARYGFTSTVNKLTRLANDAYYRFFILRNQGEVMKKEEEKIFKNEIDSMKKCIQATAIKIHPSDVHSECFRNNIEKLDPYFFLTLSGPLYQKSLLKTIRGAAINQHAGHSPMYKGSNTTHWALYHRDIKCISSTVHITTTGADAGGILRRSNTTLFPEDNVHTIFLRTVALGTELMIESVKEIIKHKEINIFHQPKDMGQTYLNKEYNLSVMKALFRDFKAGWLFMEINRRRSF